jgi:hypothetical protein
MMVGNWYCEFYDRVASTEWGSAREWWVMYWTHGPRKCNESQWMVPNPDAAGQGARET